MIFKRKVLETTFGSKYSNLKHYDNNSIDEYWSEKISNKEEEILKEEIFKIRLKNNFKLIILVL